MSTLQSPKKAFVSVQTFADEADLDDETVRKAVRRGELPSIRVGRCYRIPREALDSWRKGAHVE